MSIDLTGSIDVQRLKRFLKIARVSAVGAIVIDATLVGQKVQNARDAGEMRPWLLAIAFSFPIPKTQLIEFTNKNGDIHVK